MTDKVVTSVETRGPIPTGQVALMLAIDRATRVVEALDCTDRALSYYEADTETYAGLDGSGALWEAARIARQNLRRYYSKRLDLLYEAKDDAVEKAVAQRVARALTKAEAP